MVCFERKKVDGCSFGGVFGVDTYAYGMGGGGGAQL